MLRYLESCNLIFERGFLSHERIRKSDTKILENIQQGYVFYCDWLDDILKKGTVSLNQFQCIGIIRSILSLDPKFSSTDPTQRKFLSWQSECLHIYVYTIHVKCTIYLLCICVDQAYISK